MVEQTRVGKSEAESRRPRWYVASCRDGDAHLAASLDGGRVTPICGRPAFRPFTSLARPADPEQGCPGCMTAKTWQTYVAQA